MERNWYSVYVTSSIIKDTFFNSYVGTACYGTNKTLTVILFGTKLCEHYASYSDGTILRP